MPRKQDDDWCTNEKYKKRHLRATKGHDVADYQSRPGWVARPGGGIGGFTRTSAGRARDYRKQAGRHNCVNGKPSHGKHGKKKMWKLAQKRDQERDRKSDKALKLPLQWACMNWSPAERSRCNAQRRACARRAKVQERVDRRAQQQQLRVAAQRKYTAVAAGPAAHQGTCVKCSAVFAVSSGQQNWLQQRGFKLPTKCSACRRGGSTALLRASNSKHKAGAQHCMQIPVGFEGRIIGKGGRTAKALREAFAVSITVTDGPKVMVRGATDEAVQDAVCACRAVIANSSPITNPEAWIATWTPGHRQRQQEKRERLEGIVLCQPKAEPMSMTAGMSMLMMDGESEDSEGEAEDDTDA